MTQATAALERVAVTNDKGFITGFTDETVGKKNMIVLLSAIGADLGLSI